MAVINQITVYLPNAEPISYDLNQFNRDYVTFGRDAFHGSPQIPNDIQINGSCATVSRAHCTFGRDSRGRWAVRDDNSKNGLYYNGKRFKIRSLADGDKIYIGKNPGERVVIAYSVRESNAPHPAAPQSAHASVKRYSLRGKNRCVIGRSESCDISINHPTVSRQHCIITRQNGRFLITDNDSTNGTILNSRQLEGTAELHPMDRITIAGLTLVFSDECLYTEEQSGGVSITAEELCKVVGKRGHEKTITNDVSFTIEPNKFVAIIGGSGAGKTTLLNCLAGLTDFTSGEVWINGASIQSSGKSLRSLMGYVPQQDIVYDSLTLERMLYYSAQLRMPPDSSKEEIRQKIDETLQLVELSDHRGTLISKLSGGQRKRASIAVELLASPKLFFLDEPSSGLDPGTEKLLMQMLKRLARSGKTVIMVTHTVQNLDLCDTVICMGNGGRLCFAGAPAEALKFFGKPSLIDIYDDLSHHAEVTSERFRRYSLRQQAADELPEPEKPARVRKSFPVWLREFRILTQRYFEILLSDRFRIALLMLMPVLLTLLVCIAFQADGGFYNFLLRLSDSSLMDKLNIHFSFTRETMPFLVGKDTMSLMFSFSCAVFWTGIFNSIQEVSKERVIFERERFSGVSVSSYVLSKFVPLFLLCLVQSGVMLGILYFMTDTAATPNGDVNSAAALAYSIGSDGVVLGKNMMWLENFLSTFLCALSAMCLGLMISTLVSNEMALVLCPVCLMPQILFSGVVTRLSGLTKFLSKFITCRWSCVAFLVSARVNDLLASCKYDTGVWKKIPYVNTELGMLDECYESTYEHFFSLHGVESAWVVLSLMCVLLVTASILILRFRRSKTR